MDEEFGEGERGAGEGAGVLVAVEEFGEVALEGRRTARLQSDDGETGGDGGGQCGGGAPGDTAGRAELSGGDPGEPAALGAVRDLHPETGVFQHRHTGLEDLGAEVVVEGVDPQHDRAAQAVSLRSTAAEPGQEGLLGEAGSSRWAAIPPSRLTAGASREEVTALTSPGAREASRDSSGSQPMV